MSGFDLSELLPFYLDETDEHIAALNDSLLRLEQDPTDVKALEEAFRMFHSIKGASVVMGFEPVNHLTHHLESLFDQFRGQEADARPADARPDLPLPGRAARLPSRPPRRGTRHRRPRGADSTGHRRTRDHLAETAATAAEAGRSPTSRRSRPPAQAEAPAATRGSSRTARRCGSGFEEPERIGVTVVFEPNLPLADMKARLVLNRLAARGRVLETRSARRAARRGRVAHRIHRLADIGVRSGGAPCPGRCRRRGPDPDRALDWQATSSEPR